MKLSVVVLAIASALPAIEVSFDVSFNLGTTFEQTKNWFSKTKHRVFYLDTPVLVTNVDLKR